MRWTIVLSHQYVARSIQLYKCDVITGFEVKFQECDSVFEK